ncbi:motility associated factor glycosyltransferase family protein [Saccharibacillus alkalitolerans]|uniref:Motility associated factor glycosyltransferase family protein n=1 Tax=Saccharibacillus alkalitolerans TaxID=2705290 RepID=A0ABX0F6R0_9BACL|nr:6-hydroxymethylpterin diphosphokinase MptE-like protein [Saccharibacillus alkalitolerans]NGZ76115.1 motility associated factor glycosyltransferase family protein [Saccharibacillus alkalitolerans]
MTYFNENLSIIQQRFPNIANRIEQFNRTSEGSSSIFKEPLKRDESWLTAVEGSVNDMKVVFLYGFSQGLGLSDLLEKYPDRFFIVYEPDEAVFNHSMENYQMKDLLAWPQLLWVSVGPTQLKMLFYKICTYMDQELAFVALRHHLEKNIEVLHDLRESFEEYRATFVSNRHTERHFRKIWLQNSLNQLASMLVSPSVMELAGSFSGSTAVIVASGPSLDKDIAWLRKFQPHALIISAGSSIQALLRHNIEPHLVTVMDGGAINAKVFENPRATKPPLFFGSTAYYGVSDKKNDDTIYGIVQNDEIGKFCMGMESQDPTILPTPTVTGTAIQAAVWLGVSRIVMMGQDLSFSEGKFYTSGVEHTDATHNETIVERSQHTVLNVYGGYNQTTQNFLFMKDGLESLISILPNIEFINATRGGAAIEGAAWKPAEEVYSLLVEQRVESNAVSKLLEQTHTSNEDKINTVKSRLLNISSDISVLRSELNMLKKQIDRLSEQSRSNANKAWRTMESVEVLWGNIVNRDWFNPVFETLLTDRLNEFDRILPEIATETDIRKKADLAYHHLRKLGEDITKELPYLQENVTESLKRIAEIHI